MAYTVINFSNKKALVTAFKAGQVIEVYQPGIFGPDVKDGTVGLEGPHYPEPHKWYASGTVKDGKLVKLNK
jgi:hypothetical protein